MIAADKQSFVKVAIIDGFVQCSCRHAVADDGFLKNKEDFNPNQEWSYLLSITTPSTSMTANGLELIISL